VTNIEKSRPAAKLTVFQGPKYSPNAIGVRMISLFSSLRMKSFLKANC